MTNHSDVSEMGAKRSGTISRLPTGTVTFVFTDIEGSTRLLQRLGEDYIRVLDDHNSILREAFTANGGVEVRPVGDAFFAAFADPTNAVRAMVDAQLALQAHSWPQGAECRVRIGLHTGEAVSTADDYVGLAVHLASRISDAGHGGQILLSSATTQLAADGLPPGTELRDLGEHRLRDIPEPQRLFEVSHPDLPRVDSPLRTLSARPNNLPAQPTSFIGRDREMTDIKARVLAGAPIISLIGPGGCGKTRLAIEVAGELLGEYPDGVWLVELAEISSDALVVQAVAAALGIQEEPGRELGATLTKRLERSKALLVLDNCEHVIWGAAELADWILRSCAGVRLLSTSREPLSVDGEQTWLVPPLTVPQNGGTEGSDAVRLFVDRAEAINPRLELTQENTRLVGEICRRLDGIPLALELAAARVDVLSLSQICERLDNRFQLLTRGSRTAMLHHQTLRALVDWSYELLSPSEQELLCRLAVFAGGFTLEAAEAVVPGGPLAPDDVLDGIAGLVQRSLVQVDQSQGDARYRLLETIRQYGLEKLEARGEALEVRAQHRRWLSDLAATTRDRDFVGAAIHDRLELETGNIRAALESGLADPGGIDDALRICTDLGYYWWLRGHNSEGESWLEAALAQAEGADPVMRGHALVWRGLLAFERLDLDAVIPLTEALTIADATGDKLLKARAITWLGASLTVRGDLDAARAVLERRFEVGEDVVEEPERAGWFYLLGSLYQILGDTEASERYLADAIDLARRIGASYVLGRALPVEANKAHESGDVSAASELYKEALDMARETNDRVALARSLVFLAEASIDTGDFAGAETHLLEAAPIITRQIGFPALSARLEVAEGRLDLSRGRLEEAREHLEQVVGAPLAHRREKTMADARTTLGAVELAMGNLSAAGDQLQQAVELARHVNDLERVARAEALLERLATESQAPP